eukprot:1261585-Prymnesium_polylepis.1
MISVVRTACPGCRKPFACHAQHLRRQVRAMCSARGRARMRRVRQPRAGSTKPGAADARA